MNQDPGSQLLRQLAEERFAALTRIAATLEAQINQLRHLRDTMGTLDEAGRAAAQQRYRELRAQALRYRWYLDVQREVVGLRPHELVDRFYQVPGPLHD